MDDVADVLDRIAFGVELLGESPMRARAFKNGARIVKKMAGRVGEAYESGDLEKVRGIGKGLVEVIGAVLEGRPAEQLVELEDKIPPGIFEARGIRGLGPSKLRALWLELGCNSIGEIEYACNENRLLDLKGFGEKTQAKVLEAIAELDRNISALRRDQADTLFEETRAALEAEAHAARVVAAGQLRRGCESIEQLAIVVVGDEAAARSVLAARETTVPVEAHFCPSDDGFGVALLVATGSDAHVAAVMQRAADQGVTFSDGGITRDGTTTPCREEADVYAAVGLVPTAPERREDGVPLVAVGAVAPRLIQRGDLRGALHNHTDSSDGIHPLEQMREAAALEGLEYLGISDHSQSASYAGGLAVRQLEEQIESIAVLSQSPGPRLLTGVESDILRDGSLDYGPELLARLEIVIASVHSRFGQGPEQMTERMCAAARDPGTDIIGHPTGRLILGRPPAEFDFEAFLDACAEVGCALELNANPHRLDLHAEHLVMATDRGIKISIAADAHAGHALVHLEHGIATARRAGLTPDHILNCLPVDDLLAWIQARRASRR